MAEKKTTSSGIQKKAKTAPKKDLNEGTKSTKRAWHEPVEQLICDNSQELLNMIAVNATAAKCSIESVLSQVINEKLKTTLTADIEKYASILEKAQKIATDFDVEIRMQSGLGKFFAGSNIKMKLFFNSDTTRIAEMLILGNTNSMIDLGRGLKHIGNVHEKVRELARELLTFCEERINKMKFYL